MRKFVVVDGKNSYIYYLARENIDGYYRFVNLTDGVILEERFKFPASALNWLDNNFTWVEVEF